LRVWRRREERTLEGEKYGGKWRNIYIFLKEYFFKE